MEKDNKVYLHMGTHKTGTTTLQFSLDYNRDLLRSIGLIYPTTDNGNVAHHNWANSLSNQTHSQANVAFDIAQLWLNNLKHGEALLISAEAFYRHINTDLNYLKILKSVFNNIHVTPVLCLRGQAEYAKSLYAEWVLNWQYPHCIYRFISDFSSWFNYNEFCSKIGSLGTPVLIPYHQISGDSLPEEFIRRLGYATQLEVHDKNRRVSPPEAHIYLKRKLNNFYPNMKDKFLVNKAIHGYLSSNHPELLAPCPRLIWSGALNPTTFQRTYSIANAKLCADHRIKYADFFPKKDYDLGDPISRNVFASLDSSFNEIKKLIEKS